MEVMEVVMEVKKVVCRGKRSWSEVEWRVRVDKR